jgi:O-antigen ligase
MWLFIVAFVLSLPFIIQKIKAVLKNTAIINLLVFALVIGIAFVNGMVRGNNRPYIVADLTSYAYLAIVPAYLAVVDTQDKVKSLIKIASYSSLVLVFLTVILHFVFMFMAQGSIQTFNVAVNTVQLGGLFNFDERIYRIFFRSSICFILPFIYFFSQTLSSDESTKPKNALAYLFMSLSFIAIVLTYTRSIWLGSLIAVVIFIALNRKKFKAVLKGIAISLAAFVVFVMLSWAGYGYEGVFSNVVERISLNPMNSAEMEDDIQLMIQLESEGIRAVRFNEACDVIGDNFVLGKGLGLEINDGRPGIGKIEYTYLDIMSKMGIIGLIAFASVLIHPFAAAAKRWKSSDKRTIGVVMAVVACLIVASYFNPFITSPIGFSLYAVLISAVFAQKSGENLSESNSSGAFYVSS